MHLAPQPASPRTATSILSRTRETHKTIDGKSINCLLVEEVYISIPIPAYRGKMHHFKLLDPTENSGIHNENWTEQDVSVWSLLLHPTAK